VKQASRFDGLSFDPFSLLQDGLTAPEVDIGRRDVLKALVMAPMVVMLDEGVDPSAEVARQVVVFQQDAVLQGLVPSLDLALGLRVIRCASDMIHLPVFQPVGEFTRDVTGAVVRERARLVQDRCSIAAGGLQARSSVSVTSPTLIVVQSFHAMM